MVKIYIDNKIVYKYRNNQLYNETINNLNSLHSDKFIETRKELECKKQKCNEKGKHNICDNKTLCNRLSNILHKPESKIKETFATCIGNQEKYYKYKKGNILDKDYKDYFEK